MVEHGAGGLSLKRRRFETALKAAGAVAVKTASGNPLTISDALPGSSPVSLGVEVAGTQAGTGDPSESNIRPITGVSGEVGMTFGDAEFLAEIPAAASAFAGVRDFAAGVFRVTHGLLTFDGTEDELELVTNSISERRYVRYYIGETGTGIDNEDTFLCSHYTRHTIATTNDIVGAKFGQYAGAFRFAFRPSGISGMSNIGAVRSWLAEQAQNGTPLQASFKYQAGFEPEIPINSREIVFKNGNNVFSSNDGVIFAEYSTGTREYTDGLIAPSEDGFTASRNYTSGQFVIIGGVLYRVTANIASGGTITVGTNVAATTVGEQLALLWAALS